MQWKPLFKITAYTPADCEECFNQIVTGLLDLLEPNKRFVQYVKMHILHKISFICNNQSKHIGIRGPKEKNIYVPITKYSNRTATTIVRVQIFKV